MLLSTLTNNSGLLNLHFHQSNPHHKGYQLQTSAWIKILARGVIDHLGIDATKALFNDNNSLIKPEKALGKKLSACAKELGLYPYSQKGRFTALKPISHDIIEPILVIGPNSPFCLTRGCNRASLIQASKLSDIPKVTLIKGTTLFSQIQVLTGKCKSCNTVYYADHERTANTSLYLNSAQYLKVGKSLWIDRIFAGSVLGATYSFHASASAIAEFFTNSFTSKKNFILSRRQIWAAFVQESIRQIATDADQTFTCENNASIDEITKAAYAFLGGDGIISAAENHSCSECTQPYSNSSSIPFPNNNTSDTIMDIDSSTVTMIVIDGVCIGPKHCAYEGCQAALLNSRGGAFCEFHEHLFGNRCRVVGCQNSCELNTHACIIHQSLWKKYKETHASSHLSGVRRMLNQANENLPWNHPIPHNQQPHDEPSTHTAPPKHYFGPATFYCLETICAPCGVVIAWKKFATSESPSKIVNFINEVYPTSDMRPDYICIDKACLVLKHLIATNQWDQWKDTTRFIVDTYHYKNHKVSDTLCQKWCNPAPIDGSAPNLVIEETGADGETYLKRAFNTQVSFISMKYICLLTTS